MFLVTAADADAIRAIFDQEGELSAAIELRRRFPGIIDNAEARNTSAQSPDGSRETERLSLGPCHRRS
jgi:RecB family exonuclease